MSDPSSEPQAMAIMLYAVENNLQTERDIHEQDIEEAIISAVRNLPNLYDPSRQDYRDVLKRRHSFTSIGHKLKMKGYDVIKRWKAIRDTYAREKRSVQTKIRNGAPAGISSEWKHFASLSFLQDHVKSRKNNLMEEMDLSYDSEMEDCNDTYGIVQAFQLGDSPEDCDTKQTSFNLGNGLDVTYEFAPDVQSADGVEKCDATHNFLVVNKSITRDSLISAMPGIVVENDVVTQSLLLGNPTFEDEIDALSSSCTSSHPSAPHKEVRCQPKKLYEAMGNKLVNGFMGVDQNMLQCDLPVITNDKIGNKHEFQLAHEPTFEDNVYTESACTSQPSCYNTSKGCRPKRRFKHMEKHVIAGLMAVSQAIKQNAGPQTVTDEETVHGMNIAQRLMRLSRHQSSSAQIQILQVLHDIEFGHVT